MVPRLSSQIPHALPGPVQSKQKHICNAALASLVKASMLFYLKRLCHIETTMSNYNLHSYSGSPNRHSLQGQNSVVSPGFLPLTHTGDSPSNPPSHVYHSQASIKDQHSVQQYALSKWPTLQLQLLHCLWGACHFTRGLLFSVKKHGKTAINISESKRVLEAG